MSIQNSINSALGAVAGAVVAGKHAKEKEISKEEHIANLTGEAENLEASAAAMENDVAESASALTKKQNRLAGIQKSGKKPSEKFMTDLEAMKKSDEALNMKRTAMLNQAARKRELIGKLGGAK